MLEAPPNVSFVPMARPRTVELVRSAIKAIEAMFTPDHPTPTRNVPIVITA
jgi:hypothetical protein